MANPTYSDEVKSIQLLMSIAFPALEVRTERPESDDEQYDMLVDDAAEVTTAMRGTYMTERRVPIIIQQWVDGKMAARDVAEAIEQVLRMPVASARNDRSAIPVWDFSAGEPDLGADQPIGWLKVKDITTSVLQAEAPGSYVATVETILSTTRVTDTTTGVVLTGAQIGARFV